MITVGVDLAAAAKNTAVAVVDWLPGLVRLRQLIHPADDDAVVSAVGALGGGGKAGIDCPLGWPLPFVSLLAAHAADGAERVPEKQELLQRTTDRRLSATVLVATGGRVRLRPLSVSSDRIAVPALRMVRLERRLLRGRPPDRSGAGLLVEVYPAAALAVWGLQHRGYKGPAGRAAREQIVTGLLHLWRGALHLGGLTDALVASDHRLDALISALAAGAVARAATVPGSGPMPPEFAAARAEGWIHVPAADFPAGYGG